MKKLLIDLEKCYKCKECKAKCSYFHHPENDGYVRPIALAIQEHVCRRCEEPPCVAACPQEALEKRESDGRLERYSMRCTSCKTCTIACPFGVIFPQIVEYKTFMCDLCLDRCDDKTPPVCTKTCPENAIQWVEVKEDPKNNIYAVRDGQFFVRTVRWRE